MKSLDFIYHSLDPLRLLKQLEALQEALWQHSVKPHPSGNTDPKEKYDLHFSVNSDSEEPIKEDLFKKAQEKNKRKYRKTKKSRAPRWCRTRKDPFEKVWDEICKRLEENPERTAKSLLLELQERYPGQYPDNKLRTLQRRVQKWRSHSIITFNDAWLREETLSEKKQPQLRAMEGE